MHVIASEDKRAEDFFKRQSERKPKGVYFYRVKFL